MPRCFHVLYETYAGINPKIVFCFFEFFGNNDYIIVVTSKNINMKIYVAYIFYYTKNDQGFIDDHHIKVEVFQSIDAADMYLSYWKDTHTAYVVNGWYEANLIERTT